MAISNVSQFTLLVWKNWLLRKRRIKKTLLYILLPGVLMCLPLVLLPAAKHVSKSTSWNSFQASTTLPADLIPPKTLNGVSERDSLSATKSLKWKLVYSPSTSPAAVRMAENMTQMLHVTPMGISLTLLLGLFFVRMW